MKNNVLIIGDSFKEQYLNSIYRYCDPDGLMIFSDRIGKELKAALKESHCDYTEINENNKHSQIQTILYFTNEIGLNEVLTLTEANQEGVPVIFIKAN